MSSIAMRALDGGMVTCASPSRRLSRKGSTSFVVVATPLGHQEFGSGDLHYGEEIAGRMGAELTESYLLYNGLSGLSGMSGRLRIGSVVETANGISERTWIGVWEGVASSIKTVTYGGGPDRLIE